MKQLKINYWGDEYISGIYITIEDNEQIFYQTRWYETDEESLIQLKEELTETCELNNLKLDLSGLNYDNWKIVNV